MVPRNFLLKEHHPCSIGPGSGAQFGKKWNVMQCTSRSRICPAADGRSSRFAVVCQQDLAFLRRQSNAALHGLPSAVGGSCSTTTRKQAFSLVDRFAAQQSELHEAISLLSTQRIEQNSVFLNMRWGDIRSLFSFARGPVFRREIRLHDIVILNHIGEVNFRRWFVWKKDFVEP